MKKFNLILIFVSILFFAQLACADYLVTESAPVYPGDTTYVYVPIQNMGFGTFMEDVSVGLEPADDASANAVKILDNINSLGTINDWGEQRTAKFRIYVNPETVEGDYYFNVYITHKGQITDTATPQSTVTTKLADRILTIRGKPLVMLVNSTIGVVAPMSVNRETLVFRNSGTGTARNVVAEINLNSANSVFSILGGGKQYYLGNLKAGDEALITFDLAVDIAARPGVYNLPLKITGESNYSSDNMIGLVVAGTTDFDISYQETLGSLSLNVANVGISPASAVTVSLPRQENFQVAGSSSSVLGNLNPGDYTSAIFQLSKTPGSVNTLELEIQYTDTSGQRHSIIKSLTVELSQTGAQSAGVTSGTNYTLWFLAGIIMIVIYWKRRKITAYFQKRKG